MTWERFGYICRKASVDCAEHELLSECLRRIEGEKSCNLYGDRIEINSWPRMILDRIGGIQDENEAQDAIEIYKNLNLTKHFEEPMRFKRVLAYLSYVTVIFYIVVGIYQLKVAPSFLNAFESFELSIPKHLMFYQDYWGYFVLMVSVCLVISLLVGFEIRKLFRFRMGVENSFILKYLVFGSIRRSYLRVINIIQFPLLELMRPDSEPIDPVVVHLRAVRRSKMSLPTEMQELIEIEMQLLLENCEKQMKLISAVIAVIVVGAIFFFLASAYSPIFIIGETI